MATSIQTNEDVPECPVCSEEYREPKILPCFHVVCKKCVLSWLQKEGPLAGCPLCRAQILPDESQSQVGQDRKICRNRQGQDQAMSTAVNALPSDFALEAVVESTHVLKGHRVCGVCEERVAMAVSYCLQCELMMCYACAKMHKKYPAFRLHEMSDLDNLTTQKVAASRRFMCQNHPDKPAEIYCSLHKELVCVLCIITSHEECPGKKTVKDCAQEERQALATRAKALRDEEAALIKQIDEMKNMFERRERLIKTTFDDLQVTVERRRMAIVKEAKEAQAELERLSLSLLEQRRASVRSQAASVEYYVTSSPDNILMRMMKNLASRLRSMLQNPVPLNEGGEVAINVAKVDEIKASILSLGSVNPVLDPSEWIEVSKGKKGKAKQDKIFKQ